MPAVSDMEADSVKRVILFGPPKSGKSLAVGKLAKRMKLKWLDCENGRDVLFQLPKEQQANIDAFYVPDTRGVPMAIETCLKVIKGGECFICRAHGKVSCPICRSKTPKLPEDRICLNELIGKKDEAVVFDSLTQITNSAIANITRNKPEDYKLDWDDWTNLGKVMDTFLSEVQAARFNVICISHETEVEMEDGKMKLVPTAGTRNFSRNTAKYFGECIYAHVENKVHKMASATTYMNNIMTGSRANVKLEDIKVDAALLKIFGFDP